MKEGIRNIENSEYDLGFVDEIIDRYIKECESSMFGWGSAETHSKIKNPKLFKDAIRMWAKRIVESGDDPEDFISIDILKKLIDVVGVFEHKYDILENHNPSINCAVYALSESDIEIRKRLLGSKNEIMKVVKERFDRVGVVDSSDLNNINFDDLLVFNNDTDHDVHLIVVDECDGQKCYRSKLGSLNVIVNYELQDLISTYQPETIEIHRKK